jgi:hypothetical protein
MWCINLHCCRDCSPLARCKASDHVVILNHQTFPSNSMMLVTYLGQGLHNLVQQAARPMVVTLLHKSCQLVNTGHG